MFMEMSIATYLFGNNKYLIRFIRGLPFSPITTISGIMLS